MQTLESIYPDDFKTIEKADNQSFGKFQLKLYPFQDDDENFCNALIEIKYRALYPKESPRIKISKTWNLNNDQIKSLQTLIDDYLKE